MIRETFRLALISILRNKLRSFLTILGVVIGVAAVIAMVTVGQGSSRQVNESVSSMGSNLVTLRPGMRGMGPAQGPTRRFSLADAAALSDLPVSAAVAPTVNASATLVAGAANHPASIIGTNEDYLTVAARLLARGRNMTPAEATGGAPVCIIGETVRQKLFAGLEPIGQTMRAKSVSCQIIGVIEAKGTSSFGQDLDDLVVMPIRLVQRRMNANSDVNAVQISLGAGVSSDEGIASIQNLMRERRRIAIEGADDFTVSDSREMASMLTSINSVLSGMLSSVAAVSLLVGGIGIMNIMLVSVTERTREIGIRLAIGATARQVLTQFLVEAVVLSILGGALGILAGLAMAWGAGRFMAIPFTPDPLVIAMAFVFSALVGVIFGFFPARRASMMDPIEALRHQ